MNETKLFQITNELSAQIQNAMKTCDGTWSLSVRWGETWNHSNAGMLYHKNAGIKKVTGIEGVELGLFFDIETTQMGDLKALSQLCPFKSIHLQPRLRRKTGMLQDLTPLEGVDSIESLYLGHCTTLCDLSPLLKVPNLKNLFLNDCSAVQDIAPLINIPSLRKLNLLNCNAVNDLTILNNIPSLQTLSINGELLSDITFLQDLEQLNVEVSALSDISILLSFPKLQTLSLIGDSRRGSPLVDISPLQKLFQLRTLRFRHCTNLQNFSSLQEINLERLEFSGCSSIQDISALAQLHSLQQLKLESCTKLTDITPIQQLQNIHSLSLQNCIMIDDLSPLQRLTNLVNLNLRKCHSLSDISPLQGLFKLQILDLSGERKNCNSIADLGPIAELSKLYVLRLDYCTSLKDISPIQYLSELKTFTIDNCTSLEILSIPLGLKNADSFRVFSCDSLTDISALRKLPNLRHLEFQYCSSLSNLTPIADLKKLQSIKLLSCPSIQDLSPLSTLQNLLEIDCSKSPGIVDFNALSGLIQLQKLLISGDRYKTRTITDITPLQGLKNLNLLDLSYWTSLSDLTPLQKLHKLRCLYITNCPNVIDISPLQELYNLKTIDMGSCELLTDLSPLQNLHKLNELYLYGCKALSDLTPLQNLQQLKTLYLGACSSIQKLSGLTGLSRLHKLTVSGDRRSGSSLTDLSDLKNLPSLQIIDLSDCSELADNRTWEPLKSLPALRQIDGNFPSYFTTKILANNATNRKDWAYIQTHLDNWLHVAKQYPTEPTLLSILGQGTALNPKGYKALATIIELATRHAVSEIDGLFSAACPLIDNDIIAAAINNALAQFELPLPPESLISLHHQMPEDITIRDSTIAALIRTIKQDNTPDWSAETARALREQVDGSNYPVTTSIHDAGFSVLNNQQFDLLFSCFFGALCSSHARSTDVEWRNHFHQNLCNLALQQADDDTRNQALSDITTGLSVCIDGEWVCQRLDYLLQKAAEIDPDTSAIYAAVAQAHAIAGRWDEAEETSYHIARPRMRDQTLKRLSESVLQTDLEDRMHRAISMESALSDPLDRGNRLFSLRTHDALISNPVAFGRLVGILTEYPEQQQQLVAYVVERRPEFGSTTVKKTKAISRELQLLTIQAPMWMEAIQELAPEKYNAILEHVLPDS